jgi:asparagine synthase (glutamine-hydrolysing)
MPGIFGFISVSQAQRQPEDTLRAMMEGLRHQKVASNVQITLADNDLYVGITEPLRTTLSQSVITSEDARVTIVLTGDCIPPLGTSSQLQIEGHRSENKDNEWLLRCYEDAPEAFFENLNGLFSGVLIDRRRRIVFLFNDRYGMERLYVYEVSGTVFFASEAKAILAVAPNTRAFDAQGVAQYLAFGCTIGERSLFQGIRILPGGSLWRWDNRLLTKSSYFSPNAWEQQESLAFPVFIDELQSLLLRIVPHYCRAPSPLGVSLTAGLDTRMIMSALPADRDNLLCFTYSGEDRDPLDAHIAAQIAAACGLKHYCLRIDQSFFRDFGTWVDQTVRATDGYFGVTGAHEIYFSRRANSLAPLRLTGNFGSELLRGASTFKPIHLAPGLLAPEIAGAVANGSQNAALFSSHPVTFAAFKEAPWNLFGNMAAGRSEIGFRTPYLDNAFVALAYRKPRGSVIAQEACSTVVRRSNPQLAAIPTDMAWLGSSATSTAWVRRLAAKTAFKLDYLNNEGFPSALAPAEPLFHALMKSSGLLGLHKHLHYRSWFRGPLAPFIRERLTDPSVGRSAFWNARFIERMADHHIRGRKNFVNEINAVLTLQSVEQQLLRG